MAVLRCDLAHLNVSEFRVLGSPACCVPSPASADLCDNGAPPAFKKKLHSADSTRFPPEAGCES